MMSGRKSKTEAVATARVPEVPTRCAESERLSNDVAPRAPGRFDTEL
jgi:hypothetical protein